MPVSFKLHITKQVIEQCKNCGVDKNDVQIIGNNCAVAVVLNGLFPEVFVTGHYIYPFGMDNFRTRIELPKIAKDFIKVFDSFSGASRLRKLIPEFEFTIEIPDKIISMIDIEEILNNTSKLLLDMERQID
jgi:hypothetical protein